MKKKKIYQFIIGGVVIFVAVGYLLFAARGTMFYFLTPTELLAKGNTICDKGVRLSGEVQPGSVEWNEDKLELRFNITDASQSIPIYYQGVVPDTFKAGTEVVVEGKYSPGNIFNASAVLTKCPSKYEAEEPTQSQ